jgi:hypothetical protein
MHIMDALKNETAYANKVETENGALGFANFKSALVDFFYKVSSMRKWAKIDKINAFQHALDEDQKLAYRMLFFIRDVRGGLGERQLFRDIMLALPAETVIPLLPLIPEYGRWDDLIAMLEHPRQSVRDAVYGILRTQWNRDIENFKMDRPISLLAKWLPSIRKVNADKVKLAKKLSRECFRLKEPEYRRGLSCLREHLKVVEREMSTDNWQFIDYEKVPSKAGMIYRNAFLKHDEERRRAFLAKLEKGEAKVNAGAVYPYEIVSQYRRSLWLNDVALEAAWKALPLPKGMLENAIVVRDGSGSMMTQISGSTTALDVATSLAVLMSEHLTGPFKDRFITFSNNPKFVDLGHCRTLHEKAERAWRESEISNTDIEKTMKLVLDAAVRNNLRQEDIPTVVIISDMEFDQARRAYYNWDGGVQDEKTLFETIGRQWSDKGYKLPRLVFWNVASRTGAVPMQENENGLLLVSGFSQNILDMLSGNGGMLDILRKKLMVERYDAVTSALSTWKDKLMF